MVFCSILPIKCVFCRFGVVLLSVMWEQKKQSFVVFYAEFGKIKLIFYLSVSR